MDSNLVDINKKNKSKNGFCKLQKSKIRERCLYDESLTKHDDGCVVNDATGYCIKVNVKDNVENKKNVNV